MDIEAACGTGECITLDSVYTSSVSLSYSFVEIDTATPFTNALNSNGLNPIILGLGADGRPQNLQFPDLQGFVPIGHYPFNLRITSTDATYSNGNVYDF